MLIRVYSIKQQNGKIIKKIDLIDNSLESMEHYVGGYLKRISLIPEKGIIILCDIHAYLKRYMVTSKWEITNNRIEPVIIKIKGNHFICKEENNNIMGLDDRDLKEIQQIEREI